MAFHQYVVFAITIACRVGPQFFCIIGFEIRHRFESEYARLFGRALDGLDIEIMNWSVQLRSELEAIAPVHSLGGQQPAQSAELRSVFDAREQAFVGASVYQRDALQPGDCVDGPAVIIESETSTIVTSCYQAIKQRDGCLMLRRKT